MNLIQTQSEHAVKHVSALLRSARENLLTDRSGPEKNRAKTNPHASTVERFKVINFKYSISFSSVSVQFQFTVVSGMVKAWGLDVERVQCKWLREYTVRS